MSKTRKNGRRGFRIPRHVKIISREIMNLLQKRYEWGPIEKSIRYNKKLWSRLINRARRREDVKQIRDQRDEQ